MLLAAFHDGVKILHEPQEEHSHKHPEWSVSEPVLRLHRRDQQTSYGVPDAKYDEADSGPPYNDFTVKRAAVTLCATDPVGYVQNDRPTAHQKAQSQVANFAMLIREPHEPHVQGHVEAGENICQHPPEDITSGTHQCLCFHNNLPSCDAMS